MAPLGSFRELLSDAIDHYMVDERNTEGGILHLERACRDVVQELIDSPYFIGDEEAYMSAAIEGAVAHFLRSGEDPREMMRQVLVPALVLAAKHKIGSEEVQEVLQRR